MQAANLLEQLASSGISLSIEGEYIAAAGPVTDETVKTIRQHKPQLMELLRVGEGCCICLVEWEFSMLRLPSQIDPAMNDCWLVGKETATGRETAWFIGSKPKS